MCAFTNTLYLVRHRHSRPRHPSFSSPISRTPWRNTCRGYPLAVHSCSQLNSPCFPFSPVPLSVRSTPLYPTGAGRLYAPNQRPGSAACGTAIARTTRRPPPKASCFCNQSIYRKLRRHARFSHTSTPPKTHGTDPHTATTVNCSFGSPALAHRGRSARLQALLD